VPEELRPLFNKNEDTKMYHQLKEAVAQFQTEENILECLYKYDTQTNEDLNMLVSRYVPKFKHYGTTMSLDTRIRCVVGQHNMRYHDYYKSLLIKLGCLEENDGDNLHISSGIARIDKKKICNRRYKRKMEVKRRRKHGQLATTKQQIYEERVDRARNMGTYQTGVAILGTDDAQQSMNQTTKKQRDQMYAAVAAQKGTRHTEQSPAKIMINTSCQKKG